MKTIFTTLFLIVLSHLAFSQTIVGTDVENKNVILEEFTGIHCGYCPYGHAIAQSIQDAHPNDVFIVNIHTGGYSTPSAGEPDFRTDFGSSIAGQSGLLGYPAGTVNRHLFSGLSQGSGTAMSRDDWETASNQILAVQSYVNVAVEASIDMPSRVITIHTEAYYTGDSPESTNKLNIAILQDSTYGYQANGGNNYNHMHRLVNLVTGQWGEEITTTITGSFIDKTYTYEIPTNYNDVPVNLKHINVVAFIAENNQEIASGHGCFPTFVGEQSQNDAAVEAVSVPDEMCENSLSPVITIRNMGQENLTSLHFTYSVNGEPPVSFDWTGNLAFSKTTDITLDEVSFTLLENNTLNVSASNPNGSDDDNANDNTMDTNFNEAQYTTTTVALDFVPGPWGFEVTWELFSSDGTLINSGDGADGNHFEYLHLTLGECYTFKLHDSYGNGFKPGGYLRLTGSDGVDIRYVEGDFGSEEIIPFKPTVVSNVVENKDSKIQIYPNPANSYINIQTNSNNVSNSKFEIIDISGKVLLYGDLNKNQNKINTKSLTNGIYFLIIKLNEKTITKKITISK